MMTHHLLRFSPISCSSSSSFPRPKLHTTTTPPRDMIINFGKHKGQMLGTLPPKYLTWISTTLSKPTSRDTAHLDERFDSLRWASLASSVLTDPIYRDRLEYDMVQSHADKSSDPNAGREMMLRLGWDLEDHSKWGKVKFHLLGTSKTGRIPRVEEKKSELVMTAEVVRRREERMGRRRRKMEKAEGTLHRGLLKLETESFGKSSNGNPFPGRGSLLGRIKKEKE